MGNRREFFHFVIPSIIAFALSGVYAIVDGFFVGNTIGDAGLSAINIAYPITALLQAVGTGIGMGGAVCYAIRKAEGKEAEAKAFIAANWWLLLLASMLLSAAVALSAEPLLRLMGAADQTLVYAVDYIRIIGIGAALQIFGTGLIPFLRNYGSSVGAMVAMLGGFVTNIALDFLLVWVYGLGMKGAAEATVIGQGVTVLIALGCTLYKKQFFLRWSGPQIGTTCKAIFRIGLAPFGLALTPNLSLVLINRFSASYGGEKAIATYACISYIICIIYLVLQGVGDGSQPLMSRYYGENRPDELHAVRRMAYRFAILLAAAGGVLLFVGRSYVGVLFGASEEVSLEIVKIIPIFLVSLPFVAVTRIATAGFYATDQSVRSYILTFIEPLLMLVFMLILPRCRRLWHRTLS